MSHLCPSRAWRPLTAPTVAVALLLSGCASLKNTPEQDLALSRWSACQTRFSATYLNRVQLDGRISFWYTGASDRERMLECLRQAGKDGPSLPEAVAEPRPGAGGV